MDSGALQIGWCDGYTGAQVFPLESGVVSYKSGRNIRIVSLDGRKTTFTFKGYAVGPMTVHRINKYIAIAEYGENPSIIIYAYPSFNECAVLEGGAEICYQNIVFSESDYFVSVSGVPDFRLILWNFVTQTMLTSVTISPEPLVSLSFSQTNWRQIVTMTSSQVTLWNAEQCHKKYILLPQKIKLPALDLSEENEYMEKSELKLGRTSRSQTKMSRYSVDIPESSVAGLVGEQTEQLEDIKDVTVRVKPVSMVWLPTGDFYVGCEDGQLFKVDNEQYTVTVIYHPGLDKPKAKSEDLESLKSNDTLSIRESILSSKKEEGENVEQYPLLKPGSLSCLGLHQKGLITAGEDGVIKLINFYQDRLVLEREFDSGFPVTSLTFSPDFKDLIFGSSQGYIRSLDVFDFEEKKPYVELCPGNFVGVGGIAFSSEYCVSVKESGWVQIWKMMDGDLIASINLEKQCQTLAVSSFCHYAVVGSVSGDLYFIDLTNPEDPRVVVKHRLFKSAVKHLLFNNDTGTILFAASDDNNIFLINALPSSHFDILGFITLRGNIVAMSTCVKDSETILVVACNSNSEFPGANLLYRATFNGDFVTDISRLYNSPMCDIREEECHLLQMGLRHTILGLAVCDVNLVYGLSATSKRIVSFQLPEPDKKHKRADLILSPTAEYPGHMLKGGNLLISPHGKWLLSYGSDGQIKIRGLTTLDRTCAVVAHEYFLGGVKAVAFSDDCQYVVSCGNDGTICCSHFNVQKSKLPGAAKIKRERDVDACAENNKILADMKEFSHTDILTKRDSIIEKERKLRIDAAKQDAQDNDEIYVSPPPSPRQNATWLEQREIDAKRQENERYASVKFDLRTQIRDIRKTIHKMMAENTELPEIEQLSRHEFDLDLEEQHRLQAEGHAEIKKVREKIEYDNLAKLYLREKIKQECWDNMVVKGRALQAFNSNLEVSNFPLRERPMHVINLINTINKRRQIEKKEAELRKEIVEASTPRPIPKEDETELDEFKERNVDNPSITGSLGAQFNGDSEYFYSQFNLHTREQKMYQIVLLEDAIHRIKESFNKDFDDVYSKKELEIAKVREKNKRIAYIINYLHLEEKMSEPELNVNEKPELLLEVNDSEIKVEKYMSPEQRKKFEEEQRLEEERLARERGDNARERALDMMMGGVLEIKREDELKKDIARPSFMLTKKEDEYSEEEVKLHKEYLKKVAELNEEREKYRKQIESELRKIQLTIQEGLLAFDDVLNNLFMKKIKVTMTVYQEELKILRLRYAMLIKEEIEIRDKDLNATLEHKKKLKVLSAEAVSESRRNVDVFRNEFENLQAEDKYLDKAFRREFNDVSSVTVDLLYKQFKKRPRVLKYKAVELAKSNPYSERPTSSVQLSYQKNQMMTGMEELDKIHHAPENVEISVWDRMCKLRKIKIESETQIKLKSQVLADMLSFLQKRLEEDESLKTEIENLGSDLSRLREDEQRFVLNLEIQLLLKQGQVEVDAGPFIRDFRQSVLVHRSVVEDLNSKIKQLGESKISSMVESKDFRKGIIQLEWEHKKMSMLMEDLENKMKDIQFMKVTREIQSFLQEDDYEAKKAQEISVLEQTIVLQKKHHEKNLQEKRRILRELTRQSKVKTQANQKLDSDLQDLNVVVNERRHIEQVNCDNRDDTVNERRYQEIVHRRKLVDLAKAQAQEIAVLRAEVERLRMRTFPALVQVDR